MAKSGAIQLEVVTPTGMALSEEVDEVVAPSVQGQFGVLPGHLPLIAEKVASLYGLVRVFGAQLDPGQMTTSVHTGSELSGHAIVTDGVRVLTPFFNLYGTVALVGGAAYSAFIFWRKRVLLHRALGNILIAVGAMLPAFGGVFSRLQVPGALYLGEFFGVILLFLGFLRATIPMGKTAPELAPVD